MKAIPGIGVTVLAALTTACATPQQTVQASFDVSADCVVKRNGPTPSAQKPSGFTLGIGTIFGVGSGSRTSGPNDDYGDRDNDSDSGSSSGAGIGIGVDLGQLLTSTSYPQKAAPSPTTLAKGPMFGTAYSMNCVPVRGWVRGGWPMVVDYAPDGATATSIEIHIKGRDQPLVYPLNTLPVRRLLRFDLPDDLGDSLRSALVLVRSSPLTGATARPRGVRLFGLGAGPRAVGSVSIEQVDFQPPLLRRSAHQRASFSFFAKSDFNHLAVGVLRVVNVKGEVQVALAREFRFDGGINRNTWFGRTNPRNWDGTDAQDRVSLGNHLLQVRAWMSASDAGDWVTAWSEPTVQVVD